MTQIHIGAIPALTRRGAVCFALVNHVVIRTQAATPSQHFMPAGELGEHTWFAPSGHCHKVGLRQGALMRIFTCSNCDNTVFFENVRCMHCGRILAYFPDLAIVAAVEPLPARKGEPTLYRLVRSQPTLTDHPHPKLYRLCGNSPAYGVCNSLVPADDPEPLCEACRLNGEVPDLSDPAALRAWQSLERAKRRLLYSLRELKLPTDSRVARPNGGLMFAFVQDSPDGSMRAFTGHSDGLITINIAEADDPFREKLRKQLGEVYRTVLGHFRHEIGHYYWDRLIKGTPWLPAFRALFGSEKLDYATCVARHYANNPPQDWPVSYVSAYATMHPWEDWAETWAHYMHIVDTLGTARSYGLVLRPRPEGGAREPAMSARALDFRDFDALMSGWIPVTVALNSLNRSMGLIDPYPFVLSDQVIRKLNFVHDVVTHWNTHVERQREVIARWLEQAESSDSEPPAEPHSELPLPAAAQSSLPVQGKPVCC